MTGASAGRLDPGDMEPSLAPPPQLKPPIPVLGVKASPVATPSPLSALAPSAPHFTKQYSAPLSTGQVSEKTSVVQFSAWPLSNSKRIFDVVIASGLLLFVSPLMLLIALLIKFTSPGPVFFCAPRVGRQGQTFPMLKFRSMVHGCDGPKLTCKGDGRVTLIGRILRKFKLDELPQLVNVVRGQMSMVGPRPHLPEVFSFEPEYDAFLHLWPGVTGAASVRFRREEDVLPGMPWMELRKFYLSSVLPEKVRIELEYAKRASFWSDLRLIVLTAQCALVPSVKDAHVVPKLAEPKTSDAHSSIPETDNWAA